VSEVEDFVTPENVDQMLGRGFDHVIDAVDQVRAKAAMIACARRSGLPLLTAGGAGGQIDATQIRLADLALTIQDPLLARVRSLLRKDYGFTREAKKKFGIPGRFFRRALARTTSARFLPTANAERSQLCRFWFVGLRDCRFRPVRRR
jgi:tRNA A37 threonylcarbamoyladenosine dehydratase